MEPNSVSSDSSTPAGGPASIAKRRCVLVCQYRSCLRNGSAQVLAAFQATVPPEVFATGSDCMGQCSSGPTVQVMPDRIWYCRVKPEQVQDIVDQHLKADQPVQSLLHPRFHPPLEEDSEIP